MKRIESEVTNIPRLTKAERALAKNLSDFEIRCIVGNYYESQGMRKRSDQQIATRGDRPVHDLTTLMARRFANIETDMQKVLDAATDARPVGLWMKAQLGIGAVIAAGMLAHIDITRCPTVGHIWSFAGLNPDAKWEKGQKRPHNAQLKTICWHAGQCFMKTSGNPQSLYGKLYRERKAYEIARNDRGGNAETSAQIIASKRFAKTTEAHKHYSSGKLPPAQIDARARRYAVKIFLAHLHLVWFWFEFGKLPPKPYVLERGHAHEIFPFHLHLVPGLEQALKQNGR